MIIGLLFFQAILCAIFSGVIAGPKGREVGFWVIMGFVFGLFGLIAIAGLPTNKAAYFLPSEMRCPKCKTMLVLNESERLAGAFTCHQCNHVYDRWFPVTTGGYK